MAKYITIKEIAKQLGMSHSTVSRALSDHPRISAKTKEKVRKLAGELGYQANINAHSFRSSSSRLIGIIVPDLSIHFFARVVQGMQEVLADKDYALVLFDTKEQLESETMAVERCLRYRVDGILAAITMTTDKFDHFSHLIKQEVPLVFYDRVANFLPIPKVVTNDYQAAYNAVQHLIQRGRKQIAHITASINLNNSNNRLYGYMDALKDAGMNVNEALILYYKFEPAAIETFITKALKDYPDLDAIFVFNDYAANYSVNVLQKHGKRVPEDVAVMGFSDEPVATHMTPQLSTVKHAGEKMGQLAAQKLLAVIEKKEPLENEKIIIDPELIIREST
ncbi:LacI family DNA-binding transcriptional regulator [Marinoscillum furvescens]|uniref:LacI family transcriptional regulator n=1 Tax=Marinoscillum furvescens DSM 4134 TaxID=1122208 RepID=A0A3D9L6M5_MARFU|nr:LacI family DNA-binding transcriptional regulator [Marinoscillum furvescens]REE02011.1 LacI family transcriptional regulator [Marinoscillum furvescens DSM 4134]